MDSFKSFFDELLTLVEKYEKKQVMIKVENEPDYEFIKIFGEKIDSILTVSYTHLTLPTKA